MNLVRMAQLLDAVQQRREGEATYGRPQNRESDTGNPSKQPTI